MSAHATSREQLVEGATFPHLTTGGQWTVIRVNDDGSVFAVSDMRARRTVKAEHVDAGLAFAAAVAASKGETA